ncbi:MAG: hypothetical protein ACK5C5_01295 [Bacteroidota bacterium]
MAIQEIPYLTQQYSVIRPSGPASGSHTDIWVGIEENEMGKDKNRQEQADKKSKIRAKWSQFHVDQDNNC